MFLKDLLFPKFCLGCGYLGAYICINCQKKLSYLKKDICLYCGKDSLSGFTHPGCRRNLGIDGFLSVLHYNDFLKAIIKNIKYRLAVDVWEEFCLVVKPERLKKILIYKSLLRDDFLLEPIPLHAHKLQLRGFNQAKIIAQYLQSFLNCRKSGVLLRIRNTPSQTQLQNQKSRYHNMLGAFGVLANKNISGKNFVLVDDVVTTGSTLKEAAKVLKKNGARQVFAITIANG
ncbi:ComF family protein [Candidatus Roizmanbacteria bacterium]|nr:ComF family protein [Candidatus Roizmanbacteria bacterium]